MSVANPVISSIDGASRRIFLAQGVTDYFPIEDLYHEYRYLRRTDEALRKWEPLIKAEGNVPKGGGAFTPRYVVLLNGTKIVPFDESLQLNQLGEIITDDPDVDPSIYDISGLTTAKPIFIRPSESEIIQLNQIQLQAATFFGAVTLDQVNGYDNNTVPSGLILGTANAPCNSFTLAKQIAQQNSLTTIRVRGTAVAMDQMLDGLSIEGDNPLTSVVALMGTGNSTVATQFSRMNVTGRLNGHVIIEECGLQELTNVGDTVFPSLFRWCVFRADGVNPMITFRNEPGMEQIHFFDCASGVPGDATATIDVNGSDANWALRRYSGGISVDNMTAGNLATIEIGEGQCKFKSGCTNGQVAFRNTATITENSSSGSFAVNIVNTVAEEVWNKTLPSP